MGSSLVVGLQPPVRGFPDLTQNVEQVRVEHFPSIRAIEPLDVGVLVGLAGLDVADLDLVRFAPLQPASM